ncbi:MAG: hypothetical protein HZB40_06750 [Rhodocyclales bacterium]|nr:hypothetical protein [Rhodocyclales bacterium]
MRKYLYPLLIFALLGTGTLYWLADNLDELVAAAITQQGSAMTQARVGVEHVEIHPKSGKGVISGVFVGNPKGFKTPHALRVERIELELDLATVASDITVVRLLFIDQPDVIYEKGEVTTNFDALQKNIAAYLGPQKQARGGTRLIVEELTICNARAQASAGFMGGKTISIPLPDISLKNVGKAKGGVTPGELGQEITNALKARLSVSANFDRLKKSTGEALDKAGSAIKGLLQ